MMQFHWTFLEQMPDNTPQEDVVLPLQTILDDIPVLALTDKEATSLKNGQSLTFISKPNMERLSAAHINWQDDDGDIALAQLNDTPIAMVEVLGANIRTLRVFNV